MEYVVFAGVCAFFILIILVKGIVDDTQNKKKFIKRLYECYGSKAEHTYKAEQYASLSKYYAYHSKEGQLDDITWNDLNMDAVFQNLDYCHSSAGEEYLYYTLRTPKFTKEEMEHMEKVILYFQQNEDIRVKLQYIFARMGFTGKFSIYDYLHHLDILGQRSNRKHWLINAGYLAALAVCMIKPSVGLMGLALVMTYSITGYFSDKHEIDAYITSFAYVMRLLEAADRMKELEHTGFREEYDRMMKARKQMSGFRRGSFLVMSGSRMTGSGNPLEMIMDYVRMIFHADLIKFNSMLADIRKHTEEIDDMLTVAGYLETAIAIGEYRTYKQEYCIPVFEKNFYMKNGYHPLIENPIKNTIATDKGVLLTGSNASGKSTFLKTVAINAILAQTIHTVLAEEYRTEFYHIYSSMALRDDISSGESYYIVEIKSLKRILDAQAAAEGKILCFVDEVLRGTNTVERIAASTQILQSLAQNQVLCFAATHDIELTELLEQSYHNYHFEEEIIHGDVCFNYRLQPGRATTRNAIKLLSVMGYQNKIIQEAEKMAEHFIKDGQWK